MTDEAGPSNAGGSGDGGDDGWRVGGRRHSAPVGHRVTTRQSTAEAAASSHRPARPFGRTRRQVPDAPHDQTEVVFARSHPLQALGFHGAFQDVLVARCNGRAWRSTWQWGHAKLHEGVPWEQHAFLQEPAPKRRKLKPKKGGKARRRRALRNMPSDVWAAVFSQLPAMEHELPGLRLVCRQVPPAHGAHTIHSTLAVRGQTCMLLRVNRAADKSAFTSSTPP